LAKEQISSAIEPAQIDVDKIIGFGGITNIQWENRIGEISLILDPEERNKGRGIQAVDLLLDKAFNYLNLQTVCGECYECNPAIEFWSKILEEFVAHCCKMPNRKYWGGRYYGSMYFSIDRGNYAK
jgi:hypothetical protein